MAHKLRVTLRKSPISYTAKTRGTVRAMGLRRIGQTIELPDNPATRGMARSIRFLVEVEETPGGRAPRSSRGQPTRSGESDAATQTRQPAQPEPSGEADAAADASEESA